MVERTFGANVIFFSEAQPESLVKADFLLIQFLFQIGLKRAKQPIVAVYQSSYLESLKYVEEDRTSLHIKTLLQNITRNGSTTPTK